MITERQKMLALANLKAGKTPTEVKDLLGIPYSAVLKLRKQLLEAEERDTVHELFNLDVAALETLLDTVKNDLSITGEILGIEEQINGSVTELGKGLNGLSLLETEFQQAASQLIKQITAVAIISDEASTIVDLAKALSDLNTSFFAKGTQIQLNNFDSSASAKWLKD